MTITKCFFCSFKNGFSAYRKQCGVGFVIELLLWLSSSLSFTRTLHWFRPNHHDFGKFDLLTARVALLCNLYLFVCACVYYVCSSFVDALLYPFFPPREKNKSNFSFKSAYWCEVENAMVSVADSIRFSSQVLLVRPICTRTHSHAHRITHFALGVGWI